MYVNAKLTNSFETTCNSAQKNSNNIYCFAFCSSNGYCRPKLRALPNEGLVGDVAYTVVYPLMSDAKVASLFEYRKVKR